MAMRGDETDETVVSTGRDPPMVEGGRRREDGRTDGRRREREE
jgi:hypothetical protein